MTSNMDNSMLTPIKIPGKRYRKPPAGSELNKRRKPGRPRKEEKKQANTVLAQRTRPDNKQLKDLKPKPQRATLENLPTEVLQNIFLQSMNYSLPRSSPVLAGRLSSNYIYIQTITNVLKNSWEASIIEKWEKWDSTHVKDAEDQTELFKLRWVTPALLLDARKRWLASTFLTLESGTIARRYETQMHDFLFRHPEYEDSTAWPDTLEAALEFDQDLFDRSYSRAVQAARPYDDNGVPQLCRGQVSKSFVNDLASITRPPESILKGPWTPDKLFYLFWTLWAGASLDCADDTVLPEVAAQGLLDAIREGSLEAVSFLILTGMNHCDHEAIFKALATTEASNKAVLIVRVLDLFFCQWRKNSPKGTWEHWVEDIIKIYGAEQSMPQRRQLMKALEAEVYNYAKGVYENDTEGTWALEDWAAVERLKAVLARAE